MTDPVTVTYRFVVSGNVQGVGFRWFTQRQARALGVNGWVRNLSTGQVEVVARGGPEVMRTLEGVLRAGPGLSVVDDVEKLEVSDEVIESKSFNVK